MTIVNEILKWLGQYPNSKQVLVIEMIFFKHTSFLIIYLRWPHDNLSDPGEDESQQLMIARVNSSSENSGQDKEEKGSSSFKTVSSIDRNWAELKHEWRACQKTSNSKHRLPLYLIVSITGSLCLLTQFISFHGLHFLLTISWIFELKNSLFIILTVFQKAFQFLQFWMNDTWPSLDYICHSTNSWSAW